MTESSNNNIIETLKSRLPSGGLLCVLCAAFSLCIFAPLEIYLSNISEFWFSIKLILPLFLLVMVAVVVMLCILEVIAAIIGRSVAVGLTIVIGMLSIAAYIQGNYLVIGDTATLNGATIDWNNLSGEGLLSNIFWIIILLAIILMVVRFHNSTKVVKILSYITGCIALVEVVTLVTLLISSGDSLDKSEYFATAESEMDFAADNNTMIIVLDAFSSDEIDMLRDDNDSDVDRVLSDFTFYPDTVTMYGGTMLSVPQVMTGLGYDDSEDFETYLNEAYESSPLINRAIASDYEIGLYTTCELPTAESVRDAIVNIGGGDDCYLSSKRSFIENYYRVVAYRYAPYVLKQALWFYPDVFDYMKRSDTAGDAYNWQNGVFNEVAETVTVDDSLSGTLKLIHIKGAHGPWSTLSDGTDAAEDTSDGGNVCTEIEVLRGNLANLDRLFLAMKEQGIYDDTVIIVMADHGLNITEDRHNMQNPVLLIKGRDESHDFTISDTAVSYANMQQILENLQDGTDTEEAVADATTAADTGRYYYYFDQTEESDGGTYIGNITEYYTEGSARDWNSFQETGVVLKAAGQQ